MGKKLKVLSLFAGIGGFDLGLERATLEGAKINGFETVAFCEIEEFPRDVLAKHWPDVPCYRDVRELTAAKLAADGIAVDVITGGFPCQDVSVAAFAQGRAGINGDRSGLFSEYLRIIDETAPGFAVFENVVGLLRDGLIAILQGLKSIGYDAQWHCIPAALLGSPQARDRVWIIAHPSEERAAGQVKSLDTLKPRQGWQGRASYLQDISKDPFLAGDSWPQPLLRGVDVRVPNWVDRIGACGNAVDPRVAEFIGNAILQAEAA